MTNGIRSKQIYACTACGKAVSRHTHRGGGICQACYNKRNRRETDERIFAAIVAYKRAHDGLAPTRNMLTKLAFCCEETIKSSLCRLVKAGRVRITHNRYYAGIEVVGGKWTFEGDT